MLVGETLLGHQRAGGHRRILEEGGVPPVAGVDLVHRKSRDLHRREAVPVVQRMKQFEVHDLVARKLHRLTRDLVLVTADEVGGIGQDRHAVGPQDIQLRRRFVLTTVGTGGADGFEVRVAGQVEIRRQVFDQFESALERVGPVDQFEQGMVGEFILRAVRLHLKQLPGHAGGRSGDFADAGEHDAVGHVAFARDRFVIGFHAEAVRQGHHHSERARRRADLTPEPVGQFHSLPQSGNWLTVTTKSDSLSAIQSF